MQYTKDFSPFLRLYKYRPKQKSTPKENFVTEAFALCLYYNNNITNNFLKCFLDIDCVSEVKIETQKPNQNSIFDMTITDDLSFSVIIECKMGAPIRKLTEGDQLDKYREHIKEIKTEKRCLLFIDLHEPPTKEYTEILYKCLRWKEVIDFLLKQKGDSWNGELMRESFIELLLHLKADRKLHNGKLGWKCDYCPDFEAIGQGIFSHKKKHERGERVNFDIINKQYKDEFEKSLQPFLESLQIAESQVKMLGKVEMSNFYKTENIIKILELILPKKVWLYFVDSLAAGNRDFFSAKAYTKFRTQIINMLNQDKTDYLEKPNYLQPCYENISTLRALMG